MGRLPRLNGAQRSRCHLSPSEVIVQLLVSPVSLQNQELTSSAPLITCVKLAFIRIVCFMTHDMSKVLLMG